MPPNVGIVTFIVLMYQSWCLSNGSLALWPNWIRHQTSDLGIAGSSPVTIEYLLVKFGLKFNAHLHLHRWIHLTKVVIELNELHLPFFTLVLS